MRTLHVALLVTGLAVLLGACRRLPRTGEGLQAAAGSPDATTVPVAPPPAVSTLGAGAAPGGEDGPGGFVPRGNRRNFYAGAGGRLWYYMNCYYWVSQTAPQEDLWIKGEVVETFRDLERWPDGEPVPGPESKRTVEYWAVGANRRSVRLDNHKDYLLLADRFSAGAIAVEVTLTLGSVKVLDERGSWRKPTDHYVLEWRNYRKDRGLGADRVRFRALATEAVTAWRYRVPWSLHPQRLTRSNWQGLPLPTWSPGERRPPPVPPVPATVTPGSITRGD